MGYSLIATDAVRDANEQGYAPLSYVNVGDSTLLTASTEELGWAISHDSDRLFVDRGERYMRVTNIGTSESCPVNR